MPLHDDIAYCRGVLPGVSRTFALGIERLGEPLRDEVGIAYLVCRVLDTIEDTTSLPPVARAGLLDRSAVELAHPRLAGSCAEAIRALFAEPALDGPDHRLCRSADRVVRALHAMRPEAVDAMRRSLREMGEGMAATVRRELGGDGFQLDTMADLERYCYYVAGTVGHLLTNLFALDRPAIRGAVEARLRAREVSFGLGLQVTNIIKNVTDDVARGVAYVPRFLFDRAGIDLETLVADPADPRGRKVTAGLVEHTLPWLDQALEYTLAIPRSERDLRQFCALPLLLAVRTLALAAGSTEVFSEATLKIARDEVHRIDGTIRAALDDDDALRAAYRDESARVLAIIRRIDG